MPIREKWRWEFFGFESRQEGQPVQVWFDGLTDVERAEIVSLLVYLQNMTDRPWRKPEYDPLDGETGFSEIRVPELRLSVSGKPRTVVYRIYGWFGPTPRTYTFLHGTEKDVKNDELGKNIARRRLAELQRGAATIHKFDFSGRAHRTTIPRRNGRPN